MTLPAILVQSTIPSTVAQFSRALQSRCIRHGVICLQHAPDQSADLPLTAPWAGRAWNAALAAEAAGLVASRVLPILVDAGDLTPLDVAPVAARCTHLLPIGAPPEQSGVWQTLATACRIPMIGVQSQITKYTSAHDYDTPIIADIAQDFWLLEQITDLCRQADDRLTTLHLEAGGLDLTLHLEQPIYPLPAHPGGLWHPDELPVLLAGLPAGEPFGLYGAAPGWLYAALTLLAAPADCRIFDPCYAWVTPPTLVPGLHPDRQRLIWDAGIDTAGLNHYQFRLPSPRYPADLDGAPIPLPDTGGMLLAGELPAWLWSALARAYQRSGLIAVQRRSDAVVIHSQDRRIPVGSCLALDALPPMPIISQ